MKEILILKLIFEIINIIMEGIFVSKKINLSIQDILDKQFSVDFKGYCAAEVDAFLDFVLEDVEVYLGALEEMNQKLVESEKNNAMLRAQIIELEAKVRVPEESGNVSQVDILKRLSRLEQTVYGNKE